MKTRGFEVVKDEMRKTKGDITLPTRGTSKAMAYDFYANKDYVVEPNKIAKIWTDVNACVAYYPVTDVLRMQEFERGNWDHISENSPTGTNSCIRNTSVTG